ncbi:GNAT family N-acetyltransferase [Ovoidimarina sediminis]|uniref:GNAT family N-acetyltransferase n=1 Tax=Ovoidimarina sediminis TaxID=3079856 RepID=UPI0029119044|nr:GNAT family N-acetyltransferase [Rhodophyticola sp. MJ-SS7]MDU8945394.1 GNAT family N-acetyltransferase [Rhodophyticola sp. MJ-SS7]
MASDVITLRTAISADIPPLRRILTGSYTRLLKSSYPPSTQVTAVPIISQVNPALVTSGTYYVAVDQEDRVLGGGGWTRSIKGGGIADVRHMVTDYRYLRRGIARRVMMGIVSEARHTGISRLECLSTRMAVPFYEAMGFSIDANVTIGLRPGIDFAAVRMVKDL